MGREGRRVARERRERCHARLYPLAPTWTFWRQTSETKLFSTRKILQSNWQIRETGLTYNFTLTKKWSGFFPRECTRSVPPGVWTLGLRAPLRSTHCRDLSILKRLSKIKQKRQNGAIRYMVNWLLTSWYYANQSFSFFSFFFTKVFHFKYQNLP